MRNRQILFVAFVGCTKPQQTATPEAAAPPPPPPIEAGIPTPTVSAAAPDASAKKPPKGEPCGTVTCPANQYCCNPVMSICANPGEMCAQ